YDSLSREGFESGTEIIIWPETALPTVLIERSFYTNSISQLARELNTPIITGSSALRQFDDDLKPMNVAYLVSPDHGIEDVYSKQILVPFGERVPFQWIFPQLGNLNLGQAEFLPGLRQSIFEVKRELDTVRFSSLICYESIIPRQTRKAVKNGANLLVTISNDAWYGKTSEAHQIAALSRFRCIETRRSMVRASNTGISFLADPLGRIIRKTELLEPVSITGFLPLIEVETIYVKYGDWFLTVVSLIFGSILIYISVVKMGKAQ
ncbi:MAG: apolipoprotein N-acyltransferase, partial [Calditrichaeota bacterium]|nr:apolipoprotein N-acyltransferase [Calditrichota bacterium]